MLKIIIISSLAVILIVLGVVFNPFGAPQKNAEAERFIVSCGVIAGILGTMGFDFIREGRRLRLGVVLMFAALIIFVVGAPIG